MLAQSQSRHMWLGKYAIRLSTYRLGCLHLNLAHNISFFSNASCVTFVTFFILLMVVSWSHHHLGAHHHHYHHPHHHSRSCWQSSIKMPPNYYHRLCIHLSGQLLTFSRSRSFIKWSIIYVSDFILLPAKGRLMICISDDYLNEKYTQLRQQRWAGKFG